MNMNNSEITVNIEDIYYKRDKENNEYSKKLLDNNNSYCFYNFLDCFFCCFL